MVFPTFDLLKIAGYQHVLTNPVVADLAEKYSVSPAQIVLAWHVARGIVAVPKSSDKERQKQNINVRVSRRNWFIYLLRKQLPTLETSDVAKITALDKGERLSVKPDKTGLVNGIPLEQLGW